MELIDLPDLSQMQVRTRVNEIDVRQVAVGPGGGGHRRRPGRPGIPRQGLAHRHPRARRGRGQGQGLRRRRPARGRGRRPAAGHDRAVPDHRRPAGRRGVRAARGRVRPRRAERGLRGERRRRAADGDPRRPQRRLRRDRDRPRRGRAWSRCGIRGSRCREPQAARRPRPEHAAAGDRAHRRRRVSPRTACGRCSPPWASSSASRRSSPCSPSARARAARSWRSSRSWASTTCWSSTRPRPSPRTRRTAGPSAPASRWPTPTAVREVLPGVRRVVPLRIVDLDVQAGRKRVAASVVGTTPDYVEVMRSRPAPGASSRPARWIRCRGVCVLGPGLARELFLLASPLGERVKIGRDWYVVIGVMAAPAGRGGGRLEDARDTDRDVYIPVTCALQRLPRKIGTSETPPAGRPGGRHRPHRRDRGRPRRAPRAPPPRRRRPPPGHPPAAHPPAAVHAAHLQHRHGGDRRASRCWSAASAS